MNQTMEKLKKMEEKDYPILMRVLFGLDTPTPISLDLEDSSDGIKNLDFIDPTLNQSQKDAVRFALASKDVALIHGPPGVRCQSTENIDGSDSLLRPAKHTPSSS